MNDYKSEYIVKNILFFIIFVGIALCGITQILLPKIQIYKTQVSENRRSQLILNQTQSDFDKISTQVRDFIAQNKATFDKLYFPNAKDDSTQERAIEELNEFLHNYFLSFTLAQKKVFVEDDLQRTRLELKGYVSDSTKLVQMMENLHTLPFVLRLEVPLFVEEDSASKSSKVTLGLEIVQSRYRPHTLIIEENLQYKP